MTDTVTSLWVTINSGGLRECPQTVPMLAIKSGTGTYAFGSIQFVNDLPVSTDNPLPVSQRLAQLTLVPLDIATITMAGTPVNAISAGHRLQGGILVTADIGGMYVNELGLAGTTVAGGTMFVAPNQPYFLAPSVNAVSVNSTVSAVALAGYGMV